METFGTFILSFTKILHLLQFHFHFSQSNELPKCTYSYCNLRREGWRTRRTFKNFRSATMRYVQIKCISMAWSNSKLLALTIEPWRDIEFSWQSERTDGDPEDETNHSRNYSRLCPGKEDSIATRSFSQAGFSFARWCGLLREVRGTLQRRKLLLRNR